MTTLKKVQMILNLTLLCVMGRIIIVDINHDIIKPDIIKDDISNEDIKGNIYEKMMKISINMNTTQKLINTKPIKREATWFDY